MIRRGIDAGLAYHVGHVLECRALACDPGSPSDCLVAEIYDDDTAVFVPLDPARRCTSYFGAWGRSGGVSLSPASWNGSDCRPLPDVTTRGR